MAHLVLQRDAAAAALLTSNWSRPEALAQQVARLGGPRDFVDLNAEQKARTIRQLLHPLLFRDVSERGANEEAVLLLERFCAAAGGQREREPAEVRALSDVELADRLCAAQTARSTSSAVASGTRLQGFIVAGFTLSKVPPSEASTHSPSMSIR